VFRSRQILAPRAPGRLKSSKEGSTTNERLDAVQEAITRPVIETPRAGQLVTSVITTLHKALRGDSSTRTRCQTLHEPGAAITGILVPTPVALDSGYRAIVRDDGECCSAGTPSNYARSSTGFHLARA
jgi:hypothetical protein